MHGLVSWYSDGESMEICLIKSFSMAKAEQGKRKNGSRNGGVSKKGGERNMEPQIRVSQIYKDKLRS